MMTSAVTHQAATAGAQAIRRAVDTLRAVAQLQRSGASLSRVARATGLSTSTSFRILRSLTEERLLQYDDSERNYYIGPLAFELGLAASSNENHIAKRWRNTVDAIARQTRLTTYLMVRTDREAVCLACVQGSMALRAMPVDAGQRLPLGIGAGSLAILATLESEEIESILSSDSWKLSLLQMSKSETAAIEAIRERVLLAKQRGFAMSSGTLAPGISGVGVVVSTPGELTTVAISVSAVANEFKLNNARELASIISSAAKVPFSQQA